MFVEPPPSPGEMRFMLAGIPVRIHPFFWVVGLFLGMNSQSLAAIVSWLAALFIGILFHELGHAFAARSYGFQPLITLYGLGGLTSYMPIRQYGARSLGPLDQIFISVAGPGAGFLLAAATSAAIILTGHKMVFSIGLPYLVILEPIGAVGPLALTLFIHQLLFITVFWGIINLLPVHPLDGGHIARELFSMASPGDGARQSLVLSVLVAGILAVVGLIYWHSYFIAIMFGFLAYQSVLALQGPGMGGRY